MTKYGQPSVLFGISTASGSTAIKDLSNYIDEINGVKLEALTQQSDAFGDSWVENFYVGVRRLNPITIGGFYDDAASGPHLFMGQTSDVGAERQYELDFGSSDLIHGFAIIQSYERMPKRNELTRFQAVLLPTGAVTTAS